MTATECLARAASMDARAIQTIGGVRAEYHALAEGWRMAARLAHWQDEWTEENEISN
jgi:hypothetical protein